MPSLAKLTSRFPADASALLSEGAQRIAVLNPEEVKFLMSELADGNVATENAKSLTLSQGNGQFGRYDTLSAVPPLLDRVVAATRGWIESRAAPLKKPLGAKTLRLRYALGGVNYAHHDGCGDFQALLMLTTPGVDYGGGCFYLLDSNPPFTRTEFPFTAAGQLLVFRSNQGNGTVSYLHGMTEVTAGSEPVTKRFAVGLFQ